MLKLPPWMIVGSWKERVLDQLFVFVFGGWWRVRECDSFYYHGLLF